jgi:hypothetical protein
MFVGVAEARHPQRRRIGKRSAKVRRNGACPNRGLDRIDDLIRVVAEQLSGERHVVQPASRATAKRQQFR